MKNFDYVMYKGKICVLTEQHENKSSIAGIMMPSTGDYYFAFEIDTNNDNISECTIPVSEKSIIYRLREWRISHSNIFEFLEQEMGLIHYFSKK